MNLSNSIRKKFLINIISIELVIFIFLIVSSVVYIESIKNIMINETEEYLLDQMKTNSKKIISNSGIYYKKYLDIHSENVLNPIIKGIKDVIESEKYSLGKMNFYWDNKTSNLKSPLVFSDKENSIVSLNAPSTFIPGMGLTRLNGFYENNKQFIDNSTKMYSFFPTPYKKNNKIFSSYFGHEESGTFIRYPGVSTINYDKDRSYDPRLRSWYQLAVDFNDKTFFITDPYQDFNTKEWMITISTSLYVEGKIVGVGGIDILIEEIRNLINSIKFAETGVIHLFNKKGTIISSPEWDTSSSNSLISYKDLSYPKISSENFDKLLNSESLIINSNNINFLVNSFVFDDYIIISTVPENEVKQSILKINEETKNKTNTVLLIVVGSTVLFLIATLLLIVYFTGDLQKKFLVISEALKMISNNVGNKKMFTNVEPNFGSKSPLTEIENLRQIAISVINKGKKNEENMTSLTDNPFESYLNQNENNDGIRSVVI